MKVDELKLRVDTFVNEMIDLYMPPSNFFDKAKNATAKFWYSQNAYKMHNILDNFKDKNNEINLSQLSTYIEQALFDENGKFTFDIKEILPQEMEAIKPYLPDKVIVFEKNDLYKLLNIK